MENFSQAETEKALPSTASFRVRSLEFCCTSSIAISGTYRDPCVTISGETEDPCVPISGEYEDPRKIEGDQAGSQAGSPDCPWIKVRSRSRERPYMRDERSLPTVSPHRLVGRKVTTARDKTGVSPLHRPGTKEASRGEAKIVTDDQALPLEC